MDFLMRITVTDEDIGDAWLVPLNSSHSLPEVCGDHYDAVSSLISEMHSHMVTLNILKLKASLMFLKRDHPRNTIYKKKNELDLQSDHKHLSRLYCFWVETTQRSAQTG